MLGNNAGVYIPRDQEGGKGASEADVEQAPQTREIPVDFGSFVVSLSTSALVSLGRVPNPESGRIDRDLEAARHTIDILRMLKEKTQGNLEPEEERLLGSLLYDLRMAFVEVLKQYGGAAASAQKG